MRQDSVFRKFGDERAKALTGDPNARCYTASDDYHELYNVIQPKLEQELAQGKISQEEKKSLWKQCTKAYWRRRKPGTTKTQSIFEEVFGGKWDIHFG